MDDAHTVTSQRFGADFMCYAESRVDLAQMVGSRSMQSPYDQPLRRDDSDTVSEAKDGRRLDSSCSKHNLAQKIVQVCPRSSFHAT